MGSCGENYSQMYALLQSGELSQTVFDEFYPQVTQINLMDGIMVLKIS